MSHASRFLGWAILSLTLGCRPDASAQAQALPAPTGNWPIGVVRTTWTDSTRSDSVSVPMRPFRSVGVNLYYPASISGTSGTYLGDSLLRVLLASAPPEERPLLERARQTRSHAGSEAPLGREQHPWPVILFSHGKEMLPEFYSAQIEELVSHGYVVVAVGHPGIATAVLVNGEALPMVRDNAPFNMSVEDLQRRTEAGARQVRTMVSDLQFVTSRLAAGALPAPLVRDVLDLGRLGAAGHSFGGIAAATLCGIDRRFVACLNEDGLFAGAPYLETLVTAPSGSLLFLTKGFATTPPDRYIGADRKPMRPTAAQWSLLRASFQSRLDSAIRRFPLAPADVGMDDVEHRSFSDLALVPEPQGGAKGGVEAVTAIRRVLLAFFDRAMYPARGQSWEAMTSTAGLHVRVFQ